MQICHMSWKENKYAKSQKDKILNNNIKFATVIFPTFQLNLEEWCGGKQHLIQHF